MTILGTHYFSTDEEKWTATVTRAPRAGSDFVCVNTSSEEAVAAGFRHCPRCNPAAPVALKKYGSIIRDACALIERVEEPPSLDRLAEHVGLSRFYFHRLFKRHVGITPKEYVATYQLKKFKESLLKGMPIIEAIYEAGFTSTSRIYEKATRELGMTPAQFKAGGSGVVIRYTTMISPFGQLLVAMTEKGTCSVDLGDSSARLLERLTASFANAVLVHAEAELTGLVARVTRIASFPHTDAELPTCILSTAFQRRIWKALQRVYPTELEKGSPQEESASSPPTALGKPLQACVLALTTASWKPWFGEAPQEVPDTPAPAVLHRALRESRP